MVFGIIDGPGSGSLRGEPSCVFRTRYGGLAEEQLEVPTASASRGAEKNRGLSPWQQWVEPWYPACTLRDAAMTGLAPNL